MVKVVKFDGKDCFQGDDGIIFDAPYEAEAIYSVWKRNMGEFPVNFEFNRCSLFIRGLEAALDAIGWKIDTVPYYRLGALIPNSMND